MRRVLGLAGRLGRRGVLLAAALLAVTAVSAQATPPGDAAPAAERSQMERWKGRHCPPVGCPNVPGSPARAAMAFAAAIVLSGWVARRQR